MPRFHFSTADRPDEDGHELASLADAKCEAIKMCGAIICEDAQSFWDHADWTMTVTDDQGLMLFQLHVVGVESPAIQGQMLNPRSSG